MCLQPSSPAPSVRPEESICWYLCRTNFALPFFRNSNLEGGNRFWFLGARSNIGFEKSPKWPRCRPRPCLASSQAPQKWPLRAASRVIDAMQALNFQPNETTRRCPCPYMLRNFILAQRDGGTLGAVWCCDGDIRGVSQDF